MFDAALEWLLLPVAAVTDLVDEGGPFVFGIFLCGFVMWTLVIERLWYFTRVLPQQVRETTTNWRARTDRNSWCARQIRTAMISRVNTAMNANQLLLRVLVPLSPLLGLVGTVSGMLEVFDSMALRGITKKQMKVIGFSLVGVALILTSFLVYRAMKKK